MRDYEAEYRYMLTDPKHSEIIEHLPTLRRYASASLSVAELGVHDGSTSFAMMMGRPRTLIAVDLVRHPEIDGVEEAARDLGVRYEFLLGDSRQVTLPFIDMLFIDSFHSGNHLEAELNRHSGGVSRYILLHDTEIFGDVGEDGAPGLWSAISAFLRNHNEWRLAWHHTNNHGLSCLVRT